VKVVPWEKVSRYGIAGGTNLSDRVLRLNELSEKPDRKHTPSNFAIAPGDIF
jgi:UTP--glucose-1-phosphate uridylyltransferase